MKSPALVMLLIATLTTSPWTLAAESEPPPPSDDDASESNSGNQGTEGVFLPSEDISEDFAVSFPVDI